MLMGGEQGLEPPADPKAAAKVFIVQNEQGNKLKKEDDTIEGPHRETETTAGSKAGLK